MSDSQVSEPLMSESFGTLTFSREVMREKLPDEVYERLISTIDELRPLERDAAEAIAHGIKEWAIEHGVTHYCHWFQPLTGSTAEKHDSLLDLRDGQAIERFTGDQLIQGEPDASSFPSGGIRTTFEARGYTAWDPSSPIFVIKTRTASILTIPSIFISYHGEALDKKTPLLRSMKVISEGARKVLELFGRDVEWVRPTLGPEQEYFLVPRELYDQRIDLKLTGRTLLGAASPKDQQLDDHYFGQIRYRLLDFMHAMEVELRELGVPVKTRHNEVAPSQFELAVIYQFCNVATDQNQLVMQTIREAAREHGFEALFHEKPFAGINGNGKHCNLSLQDSLGKNLLNPGENPRENLPFLFLITGVLQGVYRYESLIRSSIATPGNDHRLGANEAPPAILSIFLGSELTKVFDEIAVGKIGTDTDPQTLDHGVDSIFHPRQDNTDRNRTSPFAFTGDKFEFRAVGGEQSVAVPMTFVNVAIGDALLDLVDQADALVKTGMDVKEAAFKVMQESVKASNPIRFEGNNYAQSWVEEAEKRGLSNNRKTPEALKIWEDDENIDLFSRHGVLSPEELKARYLVQLEKYCTKLHIEATTMVRMIETDVIPAAFEYQSCVAESLEVLKQVQEDVGVRKDAVTGQGSVLKRLSHTLVDLISETEELKVAILDAESLEDPHDSAVYYSRTVSKAMEKARASSDQIETMVDKAIWRIPSYTDLLHN
jgi:glutamine synthetase